MRIDVYEVLGSLIRFMADEIKNEKFIQSLIGHKKNETTHLCSVKR